MQVVPPRPDVGLDGELDGEFTRLRLKIDPDLRRERLPPAGKVSMAAITPSPATGGGLGRTHMSYSERKHEKAYIHTCTVKCDGRGMRRALLSLLHGRRRHGRLRGGDTGCACARCPARQRSTGKASLCSMPSGLGVSSPREDATASQPPPPRRRLAAAASPPPPRRRLAAAAHVTLTTVPRGSSAWLGKATAPRGSSRVS